MKRSLICFLILSVSLMLIACKQGNQHPLSATNASVTTAESTIPATEENVRAEKTQLHFYQGSNKTTANATLFSGDGYSIYIFEDNWNLRSDSVNEYSVTVWQNTTNEDAMLWVIKMDTTDLSTVQSWIRDSFTEYDFVEDNRGGLGGTNADGHVLDAQIKWADDIAYVLLKMYALEDAETFGVLLNVMADTLLLT